MVVYRQMELKPLNGCVLVELSDEFENVVTPDKQFSTRTKGLVKSVSDEKHEFLLGHTVYFPAYKDDAVEEIGGKKYTAIEFKELRMYV